MNKLVAVIIGIVAIGVIALVLVNMSKTSTPVTETTTNSSNANANTNANTNSPGGSGSGSAGNTNTAAPATTFQFGTPKKSAHYESNTPGHGTILTAPPTNVVIDFNFDLAPPSSISITKDRKEYGSGTFTIDSNKLAMRRSMDKNASDGLYTVNYNACWPDGSCHDGNFQFAIDRARAASFRDLRNTAEVGVRMKDIAFKEQNIRISTGTKVTWVNDDEVSHYVNTDSHPAHTYFPEQNSQELKRGGQFSTTFTTVGIYPYHCSAHAGTMTGAVIVE